MSRVSPPESDYGQDSFLDVVANVVGVLIILVMLVGIRASQSEFFAADRPVAEQVEQNEVVATEAVRVNLEELTTSVEKAVRQARSTERRLQETSAQILRVKQSTVTQEQRRTELAMYHAAVEQDLQQRRNQLSQKQQQEFDVQNRILQAKLELDALSKQQLSLMSAPAEVEQVEVVPTPVAKKVDEESSHLRLLGGRVCKVPLYELMDAIEYERATIDRLMSSGREINLTVGPIDGFRMQIKASKFSDQKSVTGPRAGSLASKDRYIPSFTFHSTSNDLGESVEVAVLPNSKLRNILQNARRKSSTVVVWVYNDSFDEFRSLKKLLQELRFAVATKAMPVGYPITASPLGTAAQSQ